MAPCREIGRASMCASSSSGANADGPGSPPLPASGAYIPPTRAPEPGSVRSGTGLGAELGFEAFRVVKFARTGQTAHSPRVSPTPRGKGPAPMTAAELRPAIDTVWVLVAASLIFFMQAGFALIEAGVTSAKNIGNILMKNLMDFAVVAIVFYAAGFAIMFGDGNPLFGTGGWFGHGDPFSALAAARVPIEAKLLFQLMFAAVAATIVSGAMVERTRFLPYLLACAVVSLVIYPVAGHWIWGGGWLAGLGFLDFAGSAVVHTTGGLTALAGAVMAGPRLGWRGTGQA